MGWVQELHVLYPGWPVVINAATYSCRLSCTGVYQ